MNIEQKQQLLKLMENSNSILIAINSNYNDDHISSGLALAMFLKQMGKNVDVICANYSPNEKFSFLVGANEIKPRLNVNRDFIITLNATNAQISNLRYERRENLIDIIIETDEGKLKKDDVSVSGGGSSYELIFTIGAANLESLGDIYHSNIKFFYETTIVNIDCQIENDDFGQINLVDVNFSSCAEIIFSLFKDNPVNPDIATALLSGLMAATDSFKSVRVTPFTLNTAAELIDLDANHELIIKNLFRIFTVDKLRLFGRSLARSKDEADGQIVWSHLTEEDFTKTNTNEKDAANFTREMFNHIPRAYIILLALEISAEKSKILAYSKKIDVLAALNRFNPVGDKQNAEFIMDCNIKEAEEQIIPHLQDFLRKY